MDFNENIGSVLGQKVTYSQEYNPTILVREPRERNRVKYEIDAANLPFVGFDNWNCYEVSFLLDNGYPLSGVGRLIYPCNNPYLVESKSLKLYLNSFNMSRWGKTEKEAIEKVTETIKRDLSCLLETQVDFKLFFDDYDRQGYRPHVMDPWLPFSDIALHIKPETLSITHFNESPALLQGHKLCEEINHINRLCIKVPFLRSNCKITHQPDWGVVFIDITSPYVILIESLARYIISFRNENHFHEEVCEMIFKRLLTTFNPTKLFVGCCYTRRGGIDICPMRATHVELIPETLRSIEQPYFKLLQQ